MEKWLGLQPKTEICNDMKQRKSVLKNRPETYEASQSETDADAENSLLGRAASETAARYAVQGLPQGVGCGCCQRVLLYGLALDME